MAVDWTELEAAAREARARAHAPYSHFAVGAAIRFEGGAVRGGANVENASFGLTECAERVAVFRGLLDGHLRVEAVLVLTDSAEPCPPCGACRQVLAEFAGPATPIRSVTLAGSARESTLGALLPDAFGPGFLGA